MFYTVNNKEYSSDSTPNQKILDQLINREVFCNMNQEMDFILSALAYDASIPEDPPFDESDYESAICDASFQTCSECGNSSYFDEVDVPDLDDSKFQNPDYDSDVPEPVDPYICPVCGLTYPTLAQARACCESETVHVCQCCGAVYSDDEYDDLDTTPPEIFEWWAVSDWFGEKLKARGEVVLDCWGKSYWGRQTTGQPISLDFVIASIAKEMQILDGQPHSWAPKPQSKSGSPTPMPSPIVPDAACYGAHTVQ